MDPVTIIRIMIDPHQDDPTTKLLWFVFPPLSCMQATLCPRVVLT